MFSYANKIIEHNNKYFILDKNSLRSIVSFKKDGNPITKYGRIGQGPGEYVSPWDFDIDTTGLYILDTKSKKSSIIVKRVLSWKKEKFLFLQML